jgi:hypothetical protein
MCFALRVRGMQIGYPADLSHRQASFFLLLGQKKETKDKPAGSRFGRQRRTKCERLDGASQ